ncbi:MAG TPA: ATPase, partial [Sphingomicrobium sp.]
MTDQPNLRQFLDEMGSFADEAGAQAPKAGAAMALPSIGHVVEIAGSGSQARLDPVALQSLLGHPDPSVAMSGQVGS